jgi:hypothetical protein
MLIGSAVGMSQVVDLDFPGIESSGGVGTGRVQRIKEEMSRPFDPSGAADEEMYATI